MGAPVEAASAGQGPEFRQRRALAGRKELSVNLGKRLKMMASQAGSACCF